jgi:hypothetical protein
VNTGATAWQDINKRLRDFLGIRVIAFNGEDQHRNKGTLRNQEAVCGIEEKRGAVNLA